MARLTDMKLAKAFVAKSAPTFAEVISTLVALSDMRPARRRDLISGLKRVASAISWRLEECPADTVWLRPKIAKVMPAALGIQKKTWINSVSNAKSAMAEVGILERDRGPPLPLSEDWQRHWDIVLASGKPNIRIPLSRFVRFCLSYESPRL